MGKEKLSCHIPTLSVCFINKLKPLPPEIYETPYGDFADLGFMGGDYHSHSGGIFSKMNKIDQVKNTILTRKITLKIVSGFNRIAVLNKIIGVDYVGIKLSIKT